MKKYAEDSCDDSETVTLTNVALFLHENSIRIDNELQYLEEQVRKLQKLDGILESVRQDLATMSKVSQGL